MDTCPYDYDWVKEANNLFDAQKENIKKTYEVITQEKDDEIRVDEENVIIPNTLTEDQKFVMVHFFGKALPLI